MVLKRLLVGPDPMMARFPEGMPPGAEGTRPALQPKLVAHHFGFLIMIMLHIPFRISFLPTCVDGSRAATDLNASATLLLLLQRDRLKIRSTYSSVAASSSRIPEQDTYIYIYIYLHIYSHPPTTRTPLKNTVKIDTNAVFFRIQFWSCFYRLETQV